MKVLIDTNIIIHREANRVINKDIGTLFRWLDQLKVEKCIHPLSYEEISNYKDKSVVETMKIKLDNYHLLKTVSKDDDSIKGIRLIDKSKNDEIDTSILKEVYNGRIDYLITEDRGIHEKAKKLKCNEKIFKIDAFLEKCVTENPELIDYEVLSVKKEFFGNINLADPFFDSFKEDYNEFETWFNRKAEDSSYVCMIGDDVMAFLYLKREDEDELYNNIQPIFEQKRRLKVGTFKVTANGIKLGERFIKIIFDNARLFNVDEIYVTIFDKREEQLRLIHLLEDWGFKRWGTKITQNGNEIVLVRECRPSPNLKQPKLSYPVVSKKARKWIVPIYPEYHTELFPDSILHNESRENFRENAPHRNAIAKVYTSRSYKRDLQAGDIIIFYRTGGRFRGVISTIGVVESIITEIRDEKHFIELCRKRSVFDDKKLSEEWNYRKNNRPFIVNFLYIHSFPTPKVNLAHLRELNIIQEAPRGFEPLSDEQFDKILKETKSHGRYIID